MVVVVVVVVFMAVCHISESPLYKDIKDVVRDFLRKNHKILITKIN